MSHTSIYGLKIKDIDLLCEIAKKKGFKTIQGNLQSKLFATTIDCIASIHIEDWNYALAIKENGEILYDHFGSKPGSMEKFHSLIQDYNQEITMKNIPMDMVQNYYTEKIDGGRKLVIEYV